MQVTTGQNRHKEDGLQLELFGLSSDENEFVSDTWGLLTFFPTKGNKWVDTCRHCLLWVQKDQQKPDDECVFAPCSGDERKDGRNGYYSIHNMPSKIFTKQNTK